MKTPSRRAVFTSRAAPGQKIQITRDGPYQVFGRVPLAKQTIDTDDRGESVHWRQGAPFPDQPEYALCRCGRSGQKPYCDGTHEKVGFVGTETASRRPLLRQAAVYEGPALTLTDAESLCAFARFCDPKGRIWNLVSRTDDPEVRRTVEYEAACCPAGRLVVWDRKTGEAIEPDLAPSIGLVEDPAQGVSGPLWVRGGIPLYGSDGTLLEVRNRVTLCRCGRAQNKPYCDGTHASSQFDDGL